MPSNVQIIRIKASRDKVWDFIKRPENWSAVLGADAVRQLPGKPSQVNVEKLVMGRTVNVAIDSDVSETEKKVGFKFGDGTMELGVKPSSDNPNNADVVLSYESTRYSPSLLSADLESMKKSLEQTLKQQLASDL